MLKKALFLMLVLIALFAVFFGPLSKRQEMREKNEDYAKKIKYLEQKQENLLEERRRLREDPEYLEKVARDKMGLVREGEVVFKFTPVTNAEVKDPEEDELGP